MGRITDSYERLARMALRAVPGRASAPSAVLLVVLAFVIAPGQGLADHDGPEGDMITVDFAFEDYAEPETATVAVRVGLVTTQVQSGLIEARMRAALADVSGDALWHFSTMIPAAGGRGASLWQGLLHTRMTPEALIAFENNLNKGAQAEQGPAITLETVDFTPSPERVQAVRANLRERAYAAARAELMTLQKTFPDADYRISKIIFGDGRPLLETPIAGLLDRTRHGGSGAIRVEDDAKVTLTARVIFLSSGDHHHHDDTAHYHGDEDQGGPEIVTNNAPLIAGPSSRTRPGRSGEGNVHIHEDGSVHRH